MKAPFLICLLLIAAIMSGCIEENAENTENEEKTTEATEDSEQYFASFNHITSCTKFVKHDNESMEDYSRNWNESSLSFYLDLCDNLVNIDPAQYNNNNSTHYLPRTILTEDGFRKAIHDQYLLVSMSSEYQTERECNGTENNSNESENAIDLLWYEGECWAKEVKISSINERSIHIFDEVTNISKPNLYFYNSDSTSGIFISFVELSNSTCDSRDGKWNASDSSCEKASDLPTGKNACNICKCICPNGAEFTCQNTYGAATSCCSKWVPIAPECGNTFDLVSPEDCQKAGGEWDDGCNFCNMPDDDANDSSEEAR